MNSTALAALGVVLAFALVAGTWISTPSEGGPGWNDESSSEGHGVVVKRLALERKVRAVEGPLSLLPDKSGAGDVLFLFPTHRPATGWEVQQVLNFVERGGLLVLAADGDHAIPWAAAFGIHFYGVPVLLPPGTNVPCVRVSLLAVSGSPSACLPSPTAFPNATRLREFSDLPLWFVAPSNDSVFLDLDHDLKLSLGDQGPLSYPMALGWNYSLGHVVAISDGDLWRNGIVREMPENLRAAVALGEQATSGGTIYFDGSSRVPSPVNHLSTPLYRMFSIFGALEVVGAGLVILGALGAMMATPKARGFQRHAPRDGESDPQVEPQALQLIHGALEQDSQQSKTNVGSKPKRPFTA